jgi:hypothetical protein
MKASSSSSSSSGSNIACAYFNVRYDKDAEAFLQRLQDGTPVTRGEWEQVKGSVDWNRNVWEERKKLLSALYVNGIYSDAEMRAGRAQAQAGKTASSPTRPIASLPVTSSRPRLTRRNSSPVLTQRGGNFSETSDAYVDYLMGGAAASPDTLMPAAVVRLEEAKLETPPEVVTEGYRKASTSQTPTGKMLAAIRALQYRNQLLMGGGGFPAAVPTHIMTGAGFVGGGGLSLQEGGRAPDVMKFLEQSPDMNWRRLNDIYALMRKDYTYTGTEDADVRTKLRAVKTAEEALRKTLVSMNLVRHLEPMLKDGKVDTTANVDGRAAAYLKRFFEENGMLKDSALDALKAVAAPLPAWFGF